VIADRALLDPRGSGSAPRFPVDAEFFSPVESVSPRSDQPAMLEPVQFQIRVAEHQQTAAQLMATIASMAGYSASIIGDYDDGSAATATEVRQRTKRSTLTRSRKLLSWKPALETILTKSLTIARDVLGHPLPADAHVSVAFPPEVSEPLAVLASTASVLRSAQAASTETLVRLLHPAWDEPEVAAELERIRDENAAAGDPLSYEL
jgi:hypothetical protein